VARVGTLLSLDDHEKSFVSVGVPERVSVESSVRGEIFVGVGIREGTYREICGELLIAEL